MGITTASIAPSQGLDLLGTHLISIQQQVTVARQIRQVTYDAERLLFGRDNAELLIRLQPEAWCVAECLDHLTQTTRTFLPAISAAIAEAPKLKRDRRLRTGFVARLFLRTLNPPYRIRFKVLPQLTPQALSPEKAWSGFVESQSELLTTLGAAAGLALDKVRIKSPVYARITYNIYGVFCMLAAHQNRHVWQMGQILKKLDNRGALAPLRHSA